MSVLGFNRPIHHQHIAIVNMCSCHGITNHMKEVRCDFIAYQIIIEIQPFFYIFLCRRGKSSGNAML